MAASLESARAKVIELSRQYLSGKPDAFDAARDLFNFLLSLTVAQRGESLRLIKTGENRSRVRTIGVLKEKPLRLNDGCFLRVFVDLRLEFDKDFGGRKLRVYEANYQYQQDVDSNAWMVRYDYVREPVSKHPPSHIQILGNLRYGSCLPNKQPLERIHFPTGRIPIEAVIRLLADQFEVPCNCEASFWRPLLSESEDAFNAIAHRPVSGPRG